MTTDRATRTGGLPPITVRPGLAVSVAVVTVLLAALTLPATVPDRPAVAYLCGGLIGAGLLVGIMLAADLMRAVAARRAGLTVSGITLGAFGSRLGVAVPARVASGEGEQARMGSGDLRADAAIAGAGLTVTGLCGALLAAAGALAPGGTFALVGQVALWAGVFALLVTLVDLLPSPRTPGGRLLAAWVLRRTGSPQRAEAVVARMGVLTGWALIALGVAATFLVGLVGLWAVLLGWLALGSSRLAQAQQRTTAALEGLFVRDVMTPAAATLSAWRTVASALDEVVLPSRQSVFGVQDFDGPLAGVALLRDLAAVPMDDRNLARVGRVAIPLDAVATARPDEPLTVAADRLARRPAAGCVVVLDDGPDGRVRMVGVLGPGEFTHAIQTAPLRGRTIVSTVPGPWGR
jgi:CBS domain-containing protein